MSDLKVEVSKLLGELKSNWKAVQAAKTGWLTNTVSKFSTAIPFLIKSIDMFMELMNKFQMPGVSKKAIVMEAISELYDFVVPGLLPWFAKPFAATIREVVLNGFVSTFIDFVVGKVREVQSV